MIPNHLLARNQIALEKAAGLLERALSRSQISDDLMRSSDWRFALRDIGTSSARNLWEGWFQGKKNRFASPLGYVLDLAIEMAEADFGNIQLFDPAERGLRIAVSKGFDSEFLDYFALVRSSDSACALAMRQNCRVIVSDVRSSPCFNPESREIMLHAGVLSVQSTPLISPSGRLLGMLSTHRRVPGRPSLAILPLLDRLARRTARLLE